MVLERLKILEAQSRQLEPAAEVFRGWMQLVGDYGAHYLADLESASAWTGVPVGSFRREFEERGEALEQVLGFLDREVFRSGINASSGKFLGYIPGGGIPTAAVGDYLAALTNRYAGVHAASPGAAEIENQCIRWLRELVGYGTAAWGTLQSGGTLATLTALAVARDSRPHSEWPRGAVYSTGQTHHAFQKCLRILGLASIQHSVVGTDRAYRIDVRDLQRRIAADRAAGLSPWILCATAGTTNSGAVDPIADVLSVCRAEGMWGHVDAAYGGFFLLTDQGKRLLSGLSEADSVVLDPHKGLFLPYGCGAVLVKDGDRLRDSFTSRADYLADVDDLGGISAADYSPEGTRHFRGLRMWLSLTVNGLANCRAALEEKLLLARYAYERLRDIEELEVGPEPELSCVVFRASAGDAATKALLDEVRQRGNVYLSSTRLAGTLYIRICILCFRTHRAHVDEALSEIAKCVAR